MTVTTAISKRPADAARTQPDHHAPRSHSDQRAWLWILIAAITIVIIHYVPFPTVKAPDGSLVYLDSTAKTTLAILIGAVILWVSEALPFPVTALLVFLLLPGLHVLNSSDPKVTPMEEAVRNGLGRPIMMFFIGVLVLSTAFIRVGLGERAVDCVLDRVGGNPEKLLFATLAIGMFLSAWVTALAAVATIFPLAMSILRRAEARPGKSNFGRALMLATCMGPLIGGMAAPTGAAPNMIVMDNLLRQKITVRFVDWMAVGFPSAMLLIPITWYILCRCYPLEPDALASVQPSEERRQPLSRREWAVIILFTGTILTWIFGPFIGEKSKFSFWQSPQWVGLLAGALCFTPGLKIMSWHDAERSVPWRALLVLGAGLAVGYAFSDSGAANYVACILFGKVVALPFVVRFFGVVLMVAVLHLILSSNTVTAAVVIPLMVAMANQFHISPWLLCAPAALTAPLAIILPTESPDALIAHSSGYFTAKEMAKAGIPITLAAVVVIGIVLNLIVPHQTALLNAAR